MAIIGLDIDQRFSYRSLTRSPRLTLTSIANSKLQVSSFNIDRDSNIDYWLIGNVCLWITNRDWIADGLDVDWSRCWMITNLHIGESSIDYLKYRCVFRQRSATKWPLLIWIIYAADDSFVNQFDAGGGEGEVEQLRLICIIIINQFTYWLNRPLKLNLIRLSDKN